MAASLISISIPIGEWVDILFNQLFDNPDDDSSAATFQHFVSPDLIYRLNHDRHDFKSFDAMLKQARQKTIIQTNSNDEVHSWQTPDGSGGGCVAHMSHFSLIDKTNGVVVKCSALTLANVRAQDGKRMLIELTEIHQVVA